MRKFALTVVRRLSAFSSIVLIDLALERFHDGLTGLNSSLREWYDSFDYASIVLIFLALEPHI